MITNPSRINSTNVLYGIDTDGRKVPDGVTSRFLDMMSKDDQAIGHYIEAEV